MGASNGRAPHQRVSPRVAPGTRVESRQYRGSVCDDGQRHWKRGVIVGHDPTLDRPLVEWSDEAGSPEALEDHEFEVCET